MCQCQKTARPRRAKNPISRHTRWVRCLCLTENTHRRPVKCFEPNPPDASAVLNEKATPIRVLSKGLV